jgi:hypothetical protein
MKKLPFIGIIMLSIILISCSKEKDIDYTKTENLIGTTWKCFEGLETGTEYIALKFISNNAVEGWTKRAAENESKDWTGSFTISGKTITILYYDEGFTGTFNWENINAQIGGSPYVFKK